jgi:hypothetical protein
VIETAAGGGVVRLRVRNDGAGGPRAGDGRARIRVKEIKIARVSGSPRMAAPAATATAGLT